MLSYLNYDIGFDFFNYVTVLLYVVVLFVLYILTTNLLQILILIFIIQE